MAILQSPAGHEDASARTPALQRSNSLPGGLVRIASFPADGSTSSNKSALESCRRASCRDSPYSARLQGRRPPALSPVTAARRERAIALPDANDEQQTYESPIMSALELEETHERPESCAAGGMASVWTTSNPEQPCDIWTRPVPTERAASSHNIWVERAAKKLDSHSVIDTRLLSSVLPGLVDFNGCRSTYTAVQPIMTTSDDLALEQADVSYVQDYTSSTNSAMGSVWGSSVNLGNMQADQSSCH